MEDALAQARGEVAARERDVEAARAQLLAATSVAAQAWDEVSTWDPAMETARTRIETAPEGCVPSTMHEFEQSISTIVVVPMVSTAPPPGLHPACAATASRDVPDTSQDSITLRRSSGLASETDRSDDPTFPVAKPVKVTGEAMAGRRSDDSVAITVRTDLNQMYTLSTPTNVLQVAGNKVMPVPWPRRADLGWWVLSFLAALYIAILPFVSRCR
jgi:hypothetical protein